MRRRFRRQEWEKGCSQPDFLVKCRSSHAAYAKCPPDPGDPMSEQRLTPGLMVIHGNHPEALRDLLCSG